MKTAAKVFTIIGMIFGFILIIPLIVGILSLNKIDSAQNKDELTVLGFLNILFCSFLGGIFMLCISDAELKKNNTQSTTDNTACEMVESKSQDSATEDQKEPK